jgi:hypothetical protein
MAVIREKRQFQIGPIGVARVSGGVPGSNAGGMIAQAVSQSANQMADMFFRAGAQQAEKAGTEQGATVSMDQVMTIDPISGAPRAYEAPKGFGTVAQEAYQRVVMSRFQASVEDEIKLKARELAVKYDGSVDRYSTAMVEYIGAMAQNAQGQFKTYITDVGTSYLNATRSAMAIDQIKRERAAAAAAQKASISEGLDALEFMVANGGPTVLAPGQDSAANFTGASVEAAIRDGADAELFSAGDLAKLNGDQRAAIARGLLRFAGNNLNDPDTIRTIRAAVGTQNPALIPEEFGYLREALTSFGSDYSSLADLEKFADGFLNDRLDAAQVIQARETEAMKAEEALSIFDLTQDAGAYASTARGSASSPVRMASSVAAQARNYFEEQTTLARNALAAGNKDSSDAILKSRDTVFEGYVEGLELRAVNGLSRDQTLQVERAVMERDASLAPASAQESVRALLNLESVKPGVADGFLAFVGSYREGAGKAVEVEQQAAAFSEATMISSEAFVAISTSPKATDQVYQEYLTTLRQVDGLRDEDRERFEKQAAYQAGVSHLSQFFTSNPTEQAVDRALSYVATGTDDGTLTASQRASLDRVREYGLASGRESEIRTQFSVLEDRAAAIRQEQKMADERRQTVVMVQAGLANPGSAKDREAYEGLLQEAYANVLNGRSVAEVLADPASITRPELAPVFDDMVSRNVLPQSLFDTFASTANGGITGPQAISALRIWGNVRSKTDQATGVEMLSPAVSGLSQEQIATLDMLYDVGRMSGESPEILAQTMNSIVRFRTDTTFKQKVENALGEPLDGFLMNLDGMDAAPPAAYNQLAAAALNLVGSSSVTNYTSDQIKDRLQRQLDRSYPDGEGIVYNSNFGERTYAALSRTVPGNEDLFKQHIISRVVSAGVDDRGQPVPAARFARGALDFLRGGTAFQRGAGKELFLQPTGSEAGATTYRVMINRPIEEGGPVAVQELIDDGAGNKIPVVMYIRTNDPAFTNMAAGRVRRNQSVDIQREEQRQQAIQETSQQIMP